MKPHNTSKSYKQKLTIYYWETLIIMLNVKFQSQRIKIEYLSEPY